MTEPNTELPRLAPGTYQLIKRIVVDEQGVSTFVDEPGGEYIKGFWHRTLSGVRRVPDAVGQEVPLRDCLASYIGGWLFGETDDSLPHDEEHFNEIGGRLAASVVQDVVAPELERLTVERDAAEQAAHLLVQQLEDLRDDVLGDESLVVPEIVAAAGRTIDRLTTEVTQLRADKDIRQGALNDVLGHERSADYYSAVEDVAELLRENKRLTAEVERLTQARENLLRELENRRISLQAQLEAMTTEAMASEQAVDDATERLSDLAEDCGIARPENLTEAIDWLQPMLDELDHWRSGRRRRSWPVVTEVPDGIRYAAELARAQGTEGGDEHDRLLREASQRLKALYDTAQVLLADRAVLSQRLRGMARRVGDWRRTSAQHYASFYEAHQELERTQESLRFADVHVPQWERIIAEHKAEIERLNNVRLNTRDAWRSDLDRIADALGLKKYLSAERIAHWAQAAGDVIRDANTARDEALSAQALAEERIALTRKALRLDDKWSVQHGALAVRQERDRLREALAKQQALLSEAREQIERTRRTERRSISAILEGLVAEARTAFIAEFGGGPSEAADKLKTVHEFAIELFKTSSPVELDQFEGARSATSEAPAEPDEFAMTLRPEGLRPSGSEAEPQSNAGLMRRLRMLVADLRLGGQIQAGDDLDALLDEFDRNAASAARSGATPENPPTRAIVFWEPGERVEYDLYWDGRVCAVPGAVIGDGGINTKGVHRTAVQTGRMMLGVVYIENHLLRCPREVTEFCGAFDIATDVSMKPCHERALPDSNRCANHTSAVAATEAEPGETVRYEPGMEFGEDGRGRRLHIEPDPDFVATPMDPSDIVEPGVSGEADTSPRPRGEVR